MDDQRLGARDLGAHLRKLGLLLAHKLLERLEIVGKRISHVHREGWNHTMRLL
jgi:hypothetical protein